MNIETLKVFRDLSDTGSFSKTADLNYISQSAVSQQIKKLEFILKCKLYNRQSGKILLTPSGEKLYGAARKIAAIHESALKTIRSMGEERQDDEVKISTIYSAGVYIIQNYIKQFIARNPRARISVEYRQFSQIYADITSGRADFGFMACPYRKAPGLAMMPVAEDEMVLIVGAASPLAGRKSVSVKELAGLDFIHFDRIFPSRHYIDAFLRRHGVKAKVKMELDNLETIKTAVASGDGVSLVPLSSVRKDENGSTLRVLKISDAEFLRPIYLIYSRGRKLSPSARNFMGIFDAFKKAAPGGAK